MVGYMHGYNLLKPFDLSLQTVQSLESRVNFRNLPSKCTIILFCLGFIRLSSIGVQPPRDNTQRQ